MRFSTIAKWEFKSSIKSRKFLILFLMQISILILMVIFFNFFTANIESDKGVTLSPSLTGFASVDISDNSGIFSNQINKDVLKINNLSYNESINRLNQGKITAALIVPENFTKNIDQFKSSNVDLFVNLEDPKQIVATNEINSTVKSISAAISNQWINSLVPQNKTVETTVKEEKTGESLPLKLINKMMIAVLLFLPLFLFGNIIVDSIVGEKERKTGEILVAMPVSHVAIIIGKNMAVVLTMAIQVGIWLIILLIAGFDINNPILVYLVVILTAFPIVGITSVISAYSKNYKEAGIGLSFIYIVIVGFLIVPALAYVSRQSISSNISPMTLVMRIFSGETLTTTEWIIPLASIALISIITFWLTIELFKRDYIMFGPRPGIIRTTLDLIGIKRI
ncbi:MAG TPA: ABC transporter permease [Methanobacterium sp.]|nr:ABC transporter permease [Methanobacterium sp.]